MAGDGTLLVNFATLGQAIADIDRALSKIRSELETLDAAGKPLLAGWDGGAKEAYHAKQLKWTQSADDLAVILTNIRKALQDSLDDYGSTERQATARFQ